MIEKPEKKRPQPRRFAGIKEGDRIIHVHDWEDDEVSGGTIKRVKHHTEYDYIVTDIWFDPVLGQNDEIAGTMIGIARFMAGVPPGRKSSYPIRGLAGAGFHYPDVYRRQQAAKAEKAEAKERLPTAADYIFQARDG